MFEDRMTYIYELSFCHNSTEIHNNVKVFAPSDLINSDIERKLLVPGGVRLLRAVISNVSVSYSSFRISRSVVSFIRHFLATAVGEVHE